MIKRLIFDVDETLITHIDFSIPEEKTLRQFNVYNESNMKNFVKAIDTYEDVYNHYNEKDYIEYIEKIMNLKLPENFLKVFFDNLSVAVPNVNNKLKEKLNELSKKYEIVALTNFFGHSQKRRLQNMEIDIFISEIFGENLIKPNIDAFKKACGNNKAQECVMIGDNPIVDIQAAQKAGLHTIWVNTKNADINDEILKSNIKNAAIVDKVENITNEMIKHL